MTKWPNADDWLLRVDALALICVAMSAHEAEAASWLLAFACGLSAVEWRCQCRYEVYRASSANFAAEHSRAPITRMPSPTEIDNAIRTRFWRMARYQKHAWADSNTATYIGPVFLALTYLEVRRKGHSPLVGHNGLAVGVARDWRIRIYLHAIAFRAAPLIAALRDDGGRIDVALAFLQSRGRLPAAAPITRPVAPVEETSSRPVPPTEKGKFGPQTTRALWAVERIVDWRKCGPTALADAVNKLLESKEGKQAGTHVGKPVTPDTTGRLLKQLRDGKLKIGRRN